MRRFLAAIAIATLTVAPLPTTAQESEMAEVALFLTVKTQPGKRDDLIALWESHLKDRAEQSDVQIRYVIARDMNDENVVRITEVYTTMAAFQENSQAPFFADYMQAAFPLLDGEPEFHMGAPHWIK